MRNRHFAFFLAIYLGFLGFQHFYLGRIGYGIVSLLFCWTGIPLLISFVHSILLLCMTPAEFDKKYNP